MPIMSIDTKFPFPFWEILGTASSPFEYPLGSFKAAFECISLIFPSSYTFSFSLPFRSLVGWAWKILNKPKLTAL